MPFLKRIPEFRYWHQRSESEYADRCIKRILLAMSPIVRGKPDKGFAADVKDALLKEYQDTVGSPPRLTFEIFNRSQMLPVNFTSYKLDIDATRADKYPVFELFMNFDLQPFVEPFLELERTLEAGVDDPKPLAMIFPLAGVHHGMVMHAASHLQVATPRLMVQHVDRNLSVEPLDYFIDALLDSGAKLSIPG